MITFETHCNIELNNEFVSFNQQDVESTGYYKYGICKEFKAAKKLTDQMLVEQNRIKLQQSTPPSYVGTLENEKIEMTQYFIKSLDHAIIICNVKDLVHSIQLFKYRIRELDLPITKQQYHYIIPRLFELMYKFRAEDAHLTIINLLALLLTKGKKLIELKINWRPLYFVFKEHCLIAQQYGSFEDFHSVSKAQQSLNVLIYSCQPFFGGDEMVKEIFEEIGGYFMPHSNYIYFCANVLYLFTPTYHLSEATTIPEWMTTYISYYWSWIDFNRDWDERWLFILSRAFKFGIHVDWTPLLPEIYTKMLKVLDLSVGSPSMSHLKPVKSKIPSVLKLSREDRMEFHSVGKIIACLLNEKTIRPAMNHFKTLISKINLYFHPSNSGHWTTELGEMTLSISKSFLKRNKYIPYSESDIKEFLDIIYPCLVNTLYSKKKNISLTIAKIMNEFSHIAPEYILPKIIENFYSSVDREEVNRLIGGIEVVSTCLHPILVSPKFPEGKTHIYNFMEIMIKSLDPIYTNKASGAFKFFNKLFATILISDENNWIGECENQIEENVTLSTSLFQDWSITFVDSTINFLLQSSTKKGNGKRENTANLFFSETLELFFSSLSNDIYKAVLNRLSTIFTSTFEPEYYKQFGEFLKSSTLRDPVQSISVFLPIFINKLFIKQKVVNNNNSNNNNNNNSSSPPNSFKYVIISDLSDQELKLYISYIGYVIFKGGHGLVEFQDVLIEILTVLMESNSKIVLKSTAKVIRKLIFSTTRIYPSNVRVVPKKYLDKNENHIKYWGSTDLNVILPIEWFEPNEKDAEFAKQLIQKFLIETNDKITTYINQLKSNVGTGVTGGKDNSNGGYDRMKLLNLLKPVYSILRSATFLIPDSTTVIQAPREDFRYPIKKFNFDHGQIRFQEFDTVKQSIFSNYQEIIKYVESVNNNEEVDVLRLISKSLLIMFYCKGDILDHTHDHLFDKWKNHKKLKGRNYLIFKAFRNHLIRQKFYFQQLDLTQLTLDSLYCLLNLSVHNYRRVRETAQKSMVNILHSFPASNQIILPICVDRLLELKTDSEIKGLSFLLQAKTIARRLKGSTEMTRKLIPTISFPLDQKFKPNTRASFSEVKKPLLLAKNLPVLFYYKSKEMEMLEQQASGVNPSWCNDHQKELILKASKFNQNLVQENRSNLTVTLTNMLNLSKSHDKKEILPWKNHLYLLSCINYYFSILFNPPPGVREGFNYQENFKEQQDIIKEAIICIAKNSACDYPFSRVYSLNSISNILAVQTSKNVEFSYQGYFGNNNERYNQLYANDLKVYDSSVAFEVYIYQLAKDEILQVLFKNDSDISRKIIGYMSQDHESESSTTFQFCQSLTNKNYSPIFPNTRMSISNRDFRVFNAKYFFGLLQCAGIKFVEDIKPTIEKLKGKTDKEDFFLLIEILAGFSRFISINDDLFTDQAVKEELFNYIQSVAFTSLTTCPNECTEAWECAIRFITHNLRHEKFEWFSTLLFSVYRKTSGTNILSGSKSIRFLRTIVIETTWKSKELINKLMEIAKHEFSNNYKQVRMEAMRLFAMLLIYQSDFSIYPPVIQSSDQQSLISFIDAISNNSPNSSGTNSPVIFNNNNNSGSGSNTTTDIQMNDININGGNTVGIPLNSTTSPPLNQVLSTKNAIKENLMILTFFLNSKNSILIRSAPILLKAISSLSADSNLEIAKDSSTCIYRMSQEFYLDSNVIDQLIGTLLSTIQSTSWKIRISVLQFIQIFFFNHSFYFTNQQIDSIVNIVLQLTKDPQIEIRENSKITLASILITFKSEPHRIMDLIKKSIANLNVKDQTFIEKHSSIIILSSIVLAYPYDIPSYIPQILEQLSKYSRNTHFKTAASTISEFWRTHKDSWEEDKRQFTETEAEAILSTKVAPSYFA